MPMTILQALEDHLNHHREGNLNDAKRRFRDVGKAGLKSGGTCIDQRAQVLLIGCSGMSPLLESDVRVCPCSGAGVIARMFRGT